MKIESRNHKLLENDNSHANNSCTENRLLHKVELLLGLAITTLVLSGFNVTILFGSLSHDVFNLVPLALYMHNL